MKERAVFYHAGCPVCVDAEKSVVEALDRTRYDVEVIHLGSEKRKIADAERIGVKSVPALALGGHVYHINFGASLVDLKRYV